MRGRFALFGAALTVLIMALLLLSSSNNATQASHETPGTDAVGTCGPADGDTDDTLPTSEPCVVDFVRIDVVDTTNNVGDDLGAFDVCAEVAASAPFDADIVVDALPDITPAGANNAFDNVNNFNDGATIMQAIISYDNELLTLGSVQQGLSLNPFIKSMLGTDPDSTVGVAGPATVIELDPGDGAADRVVVVVIGPDIGDSGTLLGKAAEEGIAGVFARLPFTAAAGPGVAEISVLGSFNDVNVTKIVQVDNGLFTINNLYGADGDSGTPTTSADDNVATSFVAIDTAGACADSDSDGIPDGLDNCPADSNDNQNDADSDGTGDACDTEEGIEGVGDCGDGFDNDGDTAIDGADSDCLSDGDGDGVPDGDDNCPAVSNDNQSDVDTDGTGDACDTEIGIVGIDDCDDGVDNDGDGFTDGADSGCQPDSDGDGIDDGSDNCPAVFNDDQSDVDTDGTGDLCDTEEGVAGIGDCGDGVDNDGDADTDGDDSLCLPDADGDGVPDGEDVCPGFDDNADADSDGTPDGCDTEEGVAGIGDCGDGFDNDGDSDTDGADSLCLPDADGDGIPDGDDNCPNDANPGQENNVHSGTTPGDACEDPDSDGVADSTDNCPDVANADQADFDSDSLGDACDDDDDNDGVNDVDDLCKDTGPAGSPANVDTNGCSDSQVDGDGDGICDPGAASSGPSECSGEDNCPSFANPDQADFDNDDLGDACDPDDDNDGFTDAVETLTDSGVLNANSTPEDEMFNPGSCSDGTDNDLDGKTDADDSGCAAVASATATPTPTPTPSGVLGVSGLPSAGGQPGGGGTLTALLLLIAGAALLAPASGILWAQRNRARRVREDK